MVRLKERVMASTAPVIETTIKNLLTAFNGESNAAAKYAAFANKADQDGYAKVASLFRAASRAEQIHAANHARVITKMGGKPFANIEPVELKSTRENLKTALAGEEYERDVMYPNFIKEAESHNNAAAVRTFHHALEAEKEHAHLYGLALRQLENWKVKTTYYVCIVCGYTTEDVNFVRCAVCGTPKEKFEHVN
jgi:rubrerythrin